MPSPKLRLRNKGWILVDAGSKADRFAILVPDCYFSHLAAAERVLSSLSAVRESTMGSCTLGHAFEATSLLTSGAAPCGNPASPAQSVSTKATHSHAAPSVILLLSHCPTLDPFLLRLGTAVLSNNSSKVATASRKLLSGEREDNISERHLLYQGWWTQPNTPSCKAQRDTA